MKKLLIKFVKIINKLMYPKYDVSNSVHSQIVIFKHGFFQKILGFNRHVPWPVHRSSTIRACNKIIPGTRTPGLSKNCHIDGRNGIVFGKNIWIGPCVKIISMNHDVNNYHEYTVAEPIKIGDNCWLGAGSIILPEVELGNHTVVAAGAVVTKSFLEGNQVIGGNPAKVIKKLEEYTSDEF
jgi:acetyltransferase-like isoleucine patch superfamily enzyme